MSAPLPKVACRGDTLTTAAVKRIGRPPKYPIADLAVGESLDVPLAGIIGTFGRDVAVKRIDDAAAQHGRVYGKRFQVRTDRREGVARCTRVA